MISIIVPAHNEASVIGRCIESMTAGGWIVRSSRMSIIVSRVGAMPLQE